MAWVSVGGPDNEHRVRDFDGANMALGQAGLVIAARPTATTVRGFALTMPAAPVAHVTCHAAHLDPLPTEKDRMVQTLSLGLVVVPPALLALLAGGLAEPSSATATGAGSEGSGRAARTGAAPIRALVRRAGIR